jgi:sarcosine oxidase subunit beta
MNRSADFVVVGGGIIGCGTACYLARLGAKKIIVLERDKFLGTGATAKSAAAVRHLFTTEINIRLSMRSLDVFEHFEEEFGIDPALVQNGYLFVASTEALWKTLQDNTAFQKRCGASVSLLEPRQALEIVPQLQVADVLGCAFGPRDGYIDPNSLLSGFVKAAKALGVRFETETELTGIRMEGGKARAAETSRGAIETDTLVAAAGPWISLVTRMAGVEIPALPYPRTLVTTEKFDLITSRLPLTIDMETGWYCRREAGGVMMGMADKSLPSGFDESVDWNWVEKMIEAGIHRIPVLAEAGISKAWTGLYTITPDHHAVIGPVPGVEGLYAIGGFSGHGIMHAPAACEALAQRLMTGRSDINLHPLRLERFAEGDLVHETAVI